MCVMPFEYLDKYNSVEYGKSSVRIFFTKEIKELVTHSYLL